MTIEQTAQLEPNPFATNDEWLAQYIFGSFYFSQGGIDLQRNIDSYAVRNYRPQFENFCVEGVSAGHNQLLLTSTSDIISGYMSSGKHFDVGRTQVEANVQDRLNSIGEQVLSASGAESDQAPKKQLEVILDIMHSRERRFLFETGRREKPEQITDRRRVLHPRFASSILLDHLVDSKDARHPVFTQLFADIKQVVIAEPEYNFARLQRLENAVAILQKRESRDLSAVFQP